MPYGHLCDNNFQKISLIRCICNISGYEFHLINMDECFEHLYFQFSDRLCLQCMSHIFDQNMFELFEIQIHLLLDVFTHTCTQNYTFGAKKCRLNYMSHNYFILLRQNPSLLEQKHTLFQIMVSCTIYIDKKKINKLGKSRNMFSQFSC